MRTGKPNHSGTSLVPNNTEHDANPRPCKKIKATPDPDSRKPHSSTSSHTSDPVGDSDKSRQRKRRDRGLIPDWIRKLTFDQMIRLLQAKYDRPSASSSDIDGPFRELEQPRTSPVDAPQAQGNLDGVRTSSRPSKGQTKPVDSGPRDNANANGTTIWRPRKQVKRTGKPGWFPVKVVPNCNDAELCTQLSPCLGALVVHVPPGKNPTDKGNGLRLSCGPFTFFRFQMVDPDRFGYHAVCQLLEVDSTFPAGDLDSWLADLVMIGHGKNTRGGADTFYHSDLPFKEPRKVTETLCNSGSPASSCPAYAGSQHSTWACRDETVSACCLSEACRTLGNDTLFARGMQQQLRRRQAEALASDLFHGVAWYEIPHGLSDLAGDIRKVGTKKLLREQRKTVTQNLASMLGQVRVPKSVQAFLGASGAAGRIQASWDASKQTLQFSYNTDAASQTSDTDYFTLKCGAGISANQTGMGKTITLLLAAYHCLDVARAYREKLPDQMRERARACLDHEGKQQAGGLTPSTTSLIIVPPEVKQQFKEEVSTLPQEMQKHIMFVTSRAEAEHWATSKESSRPRIIVTTVSWLDPKPTPNKGKDSKGEAPTESKTSTNMDPCIQAFLEYVCTTQFLFVGIDEATSLKPAKASEASTGQIGKYSRCKCWVHALKNAACVLVVSASMFDRDPTASQKRDGVKSILALMGVQMDGSALTSRSDTNIGTQVSLNESLHGLLLIGMAAITCDYRFPENRQRPYECRVMSLTVGDTPVKVLYDTACSKWQELQDLLRRYYASLDSKGLAYSIWHNRQNSWLFPGCQYQFENLQDISKRSNDTLNEVRALLLVPAPVELPESTRTKLSTLLDEIHKRLEQLEKDPVRVKWVPQRTVVINDFSRTPQEQLERCATNPRPEETRDRHGDHQSPVCVEMEVSRGQGSTVAKEIVTAGLKMGVHLAKNPKNRVLMVVPKKGDGKDPNANESIVYKELMTQAPIRDEDGNKVDSLVVLGNRNKETKPIVLYGPGHGRNIPETTHIIALCVNPDDEQFLRQVFGRAQRLSAQTDKPVEVWIWFAHSDKPSFPLF